MTAAGGAGGSYIGEASSGTATIGAGGSGIFNTGINTQISESTITAGSSGNITANANGTRSIRIGSDTGIATIDAGGSGIFNTGINIQVSNNTVIGGSSGTMTADYTGTATVYVGADGTATTANAGDAIFTTTNSSGTITDCILSTTNGGSVNVFTTGSKYGSADGSSGGNGINCYAASNLQIVNCLVKQTGNGGNGFRGTSEQNPSYPGNGGNGGNGILVKSNCTNTQIANCTISNTGVGGATGGSPATNGNGGHGIIALGQKTQINNNTIAYTGSSIDALASGLAISCTDAVASAVYGNMAHNIAASTAYFLAGTFPNSCAVDSTSGTAFTTITYPLQNIYKP